MRGFGFVDDDADERDLNYPLSRVASPGALPRSVDLTKYVDYVRDQGSTSSCVGFAITRACHMRAQIQGISSKHGSPFFAYSVGRANASDVLKPLVDSGSQPRNVIKAVQTHGLVAETKWAWDDVKNAIDYGRVNERPDWSALEAADSALLEYGPVGYYWISSDGEQRWEDYKRAIAMGLPVAFAIDVEPWFVELDDDTPVPTLDDEDVVLGSHYMTAVGYEDGETEASKNLIVVNSWGSTFGDFGFCRLSKQRVLHPSTRAAMAIEVAPKVI